MRRLEHVHTRRKVLTWACVGVIGLGVGLMLPRSTAAAIVALAGALVCLGVLAARTGGGNRLPKLAAPISLVRSRIEPVSRDRVDSSPPHSGVTVQQDGGPLRPQQLRDLDDG
jgi:hypothetical protein